MKEPYFNSIVLVLAHLLGGVMLQSELCTLLLVTEHPLFDELRKLLDETKFLELFILSAISIIELMVVVSSLFGGFSCTYIFRTSRLKGRFNSDTPVYGPDDWWFHD